MLEQEKAHDAIAFRDYYHELGIDCGKMMLDWGNAYLRPGKKDFAADCFTKVLRLEPSNSEAARKLKEIGDLEKNCNSCAGTRHK